MYQDKLAFLKKQLKQLEEGTLPEFLKRNKKIDQQYRERLKYMEVFKEYEVCFFPPKTEPKSTFFKNVKKCILHDYKIIEFVVHLSTSDCSIHSFVNVIHFFLFCLAWSHWKRLQEREKDGNKRIRGNDLFSIIDFVFEALYHCFAKYYI